MHEFDNLLNIIIIISIVIIHGTLKSPRSNGGLAIVSYILFLFGEKISLGYA